MPRAVVLQFQITPSPRFAVLLLLLHMIAAAAVYATAIPWMAKLAMFALILLSLSYYLVRDVLLLIRNSWREISLDRRQVSVVKQDGGVFEGHIVDKSFVSPYFVVLCIKREGHYFPVSRVIFPDGTIAGVFRELCVHLKFA
ncbi:MAG TPA: protein YgfX [Gallionella sp.]|nr:protein YgfX [Gallionella sp.]